MPIQPACVLQTSTAAQVLLDAESRRWFQPFFGQASSVADAARSLDEKPNSVLYRVRQWLELGLLKVESEEPRRGRVVKLYGSVADAFFVPHALSSSLDLVEWQWALNRPYLEQLFAGLMQVAQDHAPDWGVRFDAPQNGESRISAVPDPTDPRSVSESLAPLAPSLWSIVPELHLEAQDAEAMRQELLGVVSKYRQKSGGKSYICCVGLAPN